MHGGRAGPLQVMKMQSSSWSDRTHSQKYRNFTLESSENSTSSSVFAARQRLCSQSCRLCLINNEYSGCVRGLYLYPSAPLRSTRQSPGVHWWRRLLWLPWSSSETNSLRTHSATCFNRAPWDRTLHVQHSTAHMNDAWPFIKDFILTAISTLV